MITYNYIHWTIYKLEFVLIIEAVPPPMCGAMWNMAQYLNIFLSNGSETIDEDPVEDPVDCSVSSTCTNINCSLINGSISFEISPCDQVLMISIQPENYSHTFRESGMESVDNDSMLNVLLQYNKTENILELEVCITTTNTIISPGILLVYTSLYNTLVHFLV